MKWIFVKMLFTILFSKVEDRYILSRGMPHNRPRLVLAEPRSVNERTSIFYVPQWQTHVERKNKAVWQIDKWAPILHPVQTYRYMRFLTNVLNSPVVLRIR